MSRQTSAAEIKTNRRNHINDKPREGTKLRRTYDLLMTGEMIEVETLTKLQNRDRKTLGAVLIQLRDFYGLELEIFRGKRGPHGKPGSLRCVGVWEGPYLVPIEKILE